MNDIINSSFIPRNYSLPPPAYQDICGVAADGNNIDNIDDKEPLPPKYEDIIFTEEELQQSVTETESIDSDPQSTSENHPCIAQKEEDGQDLSHLDNEMSECNSVVHFTTTDI